MFKFLILGLGAYLAWKGLSGFVGNLFGKSDDAKVKAGEHKEREVSFSKDDVVDVDYREVHHDEPDDDSGGDDEQSGSRL